MQAKCFMLCIFEILPKVEKRRKMGAGNEDTVKSLNKGNNGGD